MSRVLVAELEDLVQIFDEERRHLRLFFAHEDLDARYQTFLGAHGRPLDRQRLLVAGLPGLLERALPPPSGRP